MTSGPEFTQVEQPFIDQLMSMGWKYTTGNLDHPSASGRQSFRDVLLEDDLRRALRRINLDDGGNPWLDDGRISTAVSAVQKLTSHKLVEANKEATELLLKGTPVEGVEGWDHGRSRTVHYIDWEHPENNIFRVVNQLRVDEPGGQAHKFIVPDLVLFVNGIPLVVVECKSPNISEPMDQGIDQLLRYSNQRTWVDANEGNERLFHTNQFIVSTYYDEARVGTITSKPVHYLEWKDTSPVPMAEVAAALGKDKLSSQQKLVAGMLRPELLLDIVRHFTLFAEVEGKAVKFVPRYQQYRAAQLAVHRLHTGKTRLEDGEHDRRGGIVWHTQGSGKSLTMVFLVRKLRTDPQLRRFKVVVVTDRKALQKQLADTAELSDEVVKVAKSTRKLKQFLSEKGPGLIFATIQKYQERDPHLDDQEVGDDGESIADNYTDVGEFDVLNEDDSILVMVDEAHRSHASALHANLLKALPNCVRVGFTGTPLLIGDRKKTHEIFGAFIDRYTIKQSEEDGATLPILYEGRTTEGVVANGARLDDLFEDMFTDRTPAELEAIKRKYATRGHVMEAKALIAAKARDMLRHYVANILPNGFKAQVVAVSRRATIRYREAFVAAQAEMVEQLEGLDPNLLTLGDEALEKHPDDIQFLVRAHPHLDLVRELEFAPVISGAHNDPGDWVEWTDRLKADLRVEAFKKPLVHEDPTKRSPLVFLIVKSMLLTGFDAPIEGVMYLDRHIKEHELLQAIARVNRTHGPRKKAGIVVDYFGVARHLQEALAVYAAEDVEGALQSLGDEIPKLRDRHHRVATMFDDMDDLEGCIDLLRDERLRAEFTVKLKQFLGTLDLVLPRPEGLPYVPDAKRLALLQVRTRNRYRDDIRPIGAEVGEKVRALIDKHVLSQGIDPTVAPITLTDDDFDEHLGRHTSSRAKASEMEHALRYHIRKYLDEDPEHYQKLSERLDHLLTELKGQMDLQLDALKKLVTEAKAGRKTDDTGLDPETHAPFLGVLRQEVVGDREMESGELDQLCETTVGLVEHIQQEIRLVGFWSNAHAQEVLRKWIVGCLDDAGIGPWDRLPEIADRLVELAKVNHPRLVR